MSKITNDCLTRSGTGCFIAVPIWQQLVSKGCDCVFQCKEKMRPVKKALKQLGSPELSGESHEAHLEHTRRCLLRIGDHINDLLATVGRASEVRDWRK